MKVAVLSAVICLAAFGLRTDAAPQDAPQFAAASIKPNTSGTTGMAIGCHGVGADKSNVMEHFGEGSGPAVKAPSPAVGSCSAVNASLKMLMAYAYDLKVDTGRINDRVLFGPAWASTARFDIDAKATAPTTEVALRTMLQTLLSDRFKLQLRRESLEQAGYALRVGPKGAKLSPPTNQLSPASTLHVGPSAPTLHWMQMKDFAAFLSARLRKPVMDDTHLKGSYDIVLPALASQNAVGHDEALLGGVQQVGLELDAETLTTVTIIIDDAHNPEDVSGTAAASPTKNLPGPVVRLNNSAPAGNATRPASVSLGCELDLSTHPHTQPAVSSSETVSREGGPLDLQSVISAASQYVTRYEAQLGNVIGEEVYVQNARWTAGPLSALPLIPGRPVIAPPAQNQDRQRRTEADFSILKVGDSWVGVREVTCVDGQTVKKTQDFQKVAENAPQAGLLEALERLAKESASYNIGDVVRTTNLPTFALRILRPANLSRFQFEKAGETVVAGADTWIVRFQEVRAQTIIHDLAGADEFSSGNLWIEPGTGRVLRTELKVAQSVGGTPFRSRTEVDFEYSSTLGMLAPGVMQEHYETDAGQSIDCRADYFNFRRFQVETRFNFGPPPPK